MLRIVIIGPAHPLRGGLATFNQRLVQQFQQEGDDCSIVSFSLQYPAFMFPGTTQFSSDPPPTDITIHTWINSVHPLNWWRIGNKLRQWKPDVIVVRFWLPVMGAALGTILRRVKKNRYTKIICLADNVIPHEKRPGDTLFTTYFLSACDAFITMSENVLLDLGKFNTGKPVRLVRHPLYDSFGSAMAKGTARELLGLGKDDKIILFFGFIRAYKGLDLLLEAMAHEKIREENIFLLVAGEFYEEATPYLQMIQQYRLSDHVIMNTHFIADDEVGVYLSACDCIVQPYKHATQSGVTPLAYHFEKPMIVTNVGGLPSMVPHEKVGLVCEPESGSIAAAILRFYQLGENFFIPHLRSEKLKYSWAKLTEAIREVSGEVEIAGRHRH